MRMLPLVIDAGKRSFFSIKSDPNFYLLLLSQGMKGKLMIPIDMINWILKQLFAQHKVLKELTVKAAESREGVLLSAEIEVLDEKLKAQVLCKLDELQISAEKILCNIQLQNLMVQTAEQSSMAEMLKMVDLQKPGELMNWLPQKPPFLVDASGDQITFDFAKMPVLQRILFFPRVLQIISKWLPSISIQVGKKAILFQSAKRKKSQKNRVREIKSQKK